MWADEKKGFRELNRLGRSGSDFFFLISYDRSRIFAAKLEHLNGILYKLENWKNYDERVLEKPYFFEKFPVFSNRYEKSIENVKEQIRAGNTYLLNLTFPSQIHTNLDLEEIFYYAKSEYKLHIPEIFTCFSPEKFIEIEDNEILTYPMKGTIDASLPNAASTILSNEKEKAEHIMITDLMRNDLNRIAKNVHVKRFRYIDKIEAGKNKLLQVSSQISGILDTDWRSRIGDMLAEITPAGSVTGTPKKRTISIIREIEGYERGFYTGVFGICMKNRLRSAVLIRFIEKKGGLLIYKSGGGITIDSDPEKEYRELIDKIYIPL